MKWPLDNGIQCFIWNLIKIALAYLPSLHGNIGQYFCKILCLKTSSIHDRFTGFEPTLTAIFRCENSIELFKHRSWRYVSLLLSIIAPGQLLKNMLAFSIDETILHEPLIKRVAYLTIHWFRNRAFEYDKVKYIYQTINFDDLYTFKSIQCFY